MIGALLLIAAALAGVYLLKPSSNASDVRSAAELEREMDRSQAVASARQRQVDAERKAAFD